MISKILPIYWCFHLERQKICGLNVKIKLYSWKNVTTFSKPVTKFTTHKLKLLVTEIILHSGMETKKFCRVNKSFSSTILA